MPVTPLPPDNTPRGLIEYTSGGLPHVAQCRFSTLTTPSAALSQIEGLVDAMLALMGSDDGITGGLWIPAGSTVSQPWDVPASSGGHSPYLEDDFHRASFFAWAGRSTAGHKVRWTFFTGAAAGGTEARIERSGASSLLQTLYDEVRDPATGLVAIDGFTPVWKAYINIGYNSYFQRKGR